MQNKNKITSLQRILMLPAFSTNHGVTIICHGLAGEEETTAFARKLDTILLLLNIW